MKFFIVNREIKANDETLISNNSDYTAQFTFDDEWKDKIKTARFVNQNSNSVDVLLEDDKCSIPVEILKAGIVKVGVYCDTMATTTCIFNVKASIKETGGETPSPTPDVYSQLLAEMQSGFAEEKIAAAVETYFQTNPPLTEDDVKRIIEESKATDGSDAGDATT